MIRLTICGLVLTLGVAPAMLQAGEDAEAVKRLLERLRKKDDRVVPALVRHGAAAVPGLVAVVKEGNAETQGIAMDALGRIGAAAKDAVPVLGEGLAESSNDALAAQAAQALGKIGPAAVPELIRVLEKGTAGRTILAARAIAQIGPAGKDAEPALVKQLKAAKEPRRRRSTSMRWWRWGRPPGARCRRWSSWHGTARRRRRRFTSWSAWARWAPQPRRQSPTSPA